METVVINQIKDQSYTMKESLRALKTSISFSGKGVKSILFTSSVPNEGKTTVVMDLARSMADSKKSVRHRTSQIHNYGCLSFIWHAAGKEDGL